MAQVKSELTFETMGQNVRGAFDAASHEIVLRIKADKATIAGAQPSASGKTLTVGSTSGFKPLGPVSVSLNVSAKRPGGVPQT